MGKFIEKTILLIGAELVSYNALLIGKRLNNLHFTL